MTKKTATSKKTNYHYREWLRKSDKDGEGYVQWNVSTSASGDVDTSFRVNDGSDHVYFGAYFAREGRCSAEHKKCFKKHLDEIDALVDALCVYGATAHEAFDASVSAPKPMSEEE